MNLSLGRRRRYEELCAAMASQGGKADGESGDVSLLLRFPDGSSLKARFWRGAPLAAAAALGLDSAWAKGCQPAEVTFYRGFPPTYVPMDTVITDDLQRAVLTLREGGPPAPEQESEQPSESVEVQTRTVNIELHGTAETSSLAINSGAATALVAPVRTLSSQETREESIQHVMAATGVHRSSAVTALQECSWSAEDAANRILDAQMQTREALRANAAQRQPSIGTVGAIRSTSFEGHGTVGLQYRARGATGNICGGEDWVKDCIIGGSAGCLLACLVGLKATFF